MDQDNEFDQTIASIDQLLGDRIQIDTLIYLAKQQPSVAQRTAILEAARRCFRDDSALLATTIAAIETEFNSLPSASSTDSV